MAPDAHEAAKALPSHLNRPANLRSVRELSSNPSSPGRYL